MDAGGEKRIQCRKCGCEHLPVVYVRKRAEGTVRVRQCRHCGTRLRTRELPTGTIGTPTPRRKKRRRGP